MHLSKRFGKDGFSWTIRWREGKKRYCHTLKDVHDEKLATIAFNEFLKRRERGAVGLPTDPNYTVAEALDAVVRERRGRVREGQTTQHGVMARRLCRILGDNTPAGRLTLGDVGRVRQALKGEKMAPPTINKNVGLLLAAVKRAASSGIIDHNPIPIEDVEHVSDDRPPVWRFLTEDESATLFAALEDGYTVTCKSRAGNEYQTRYRPSADMGELVAFLLNTGARLGEGLAVRWKDVDFKAGHVRLLATKKAARGRRAEPRFIPLNDALRSMLDRLFKERKPAASDAVLTINHWNIKSIFQNLCVRAGLGHVRVHDLRHTFCSHLAMGGIPIPTIKALAGHASIAMTMRYSHLSPGKTKDAVGILNFGGDKGQQAEVVDLAG